MSYVSNSSGFAVGATSVTVAHTVSGTNRGLLVGVTCLAGDTCTGVTYNGVACTQLGKVGIPVAGWFVYVYGLVAPDTGTNNIVASSSASTNIFVDAVQYDDVKQTSPFEVVSTNTASAGSVLTCSLTTLTNNSWTFMYAGHGAHNYTAGSGFTTRGTDPDQFIAGDSGAGLSVGSTSMTLNADASTVPRMAGVMVAFAPATSSGATGSLLRLFCG